MTNFINLTNLINLKNSKLYAETADRQERPLVDRPLFVAVLVPEILVHVRCVEHVLKLHVGYDAPVLVIPFFINADIEPIINLISHRILLLFDFVNISWYFFITISNYYYYINFG